MPIVNPGLKLLADWVPVRACNYRVLPPLCYPGEMLRRFSRLLKIVTITFLPVKELQGNVVKESWGKWRYLICNTQYRFIFMLLVRLGLLFLLLFVVVLLLAFSFVFITAFIAHNHAPLVP